MSSRIALRTCPFALAAFLVATGCGKEEASSASASSKAATPADVKIASSSDSASSTGTGSAEMDAQKAAEQMKEGLKQLNDGKEIKALAPSELKAMLPETIGTAKRSNSKSEHTNVMGMDIASTEADYAPEAAEGSDNPPSYHVKITDLGNVSGAMLGGFASWAMVQTESETDTFYEKTMQYKGFPGQESYDKESKYGTLNVFVAKRFTVEVSGNETTVDQIRGILDGIDVAKLATMAR